MANSTFTRQYNAYIAIYSQDANADQYLIPSFKGITKNRDVSYVIQKELYLKPPHYNRHSSFWITYTSLPAGKEVS